MQRIFENVSISLLALTAIIGLSTLCPAQADKTLPRIASLQWGEPGSSAKGGCGNHAIALTETGADDVFFDSHDDGRDAWMNVDGRNVRLRLLKSTINYLDKYGTADAVYSYRFIDIFITVKLRLLSDYTTFVPATVTLRSGKSRRTIKGFVIPQCDAI